MKQIYFLMAVVIGLISGAPLYAQTPLQEVTLTVSSDGPTKDDATKNALRSAIEQAYGAFVSANTTILNDEMVKDEIVTVSNGSIKEYTEVSSIQTGNGGYFVTLTATVSLPHLITYAKSHGSECEFAGNTFGMEMKLIELQKENELKALYNLTDQVLAMLPNELQYDLKVGEPAVATSLPEYEHSAMLRFEDKNDNRHRHSADPWVLRYEVEGSSVASVDSTAHLFLMKLDDSHRNQTISEYYSIPMQITIRSSEDEKLNVENIGDIVVDEKLDRSFGELSNINKIIYSTLDALSLSNEQVMALKKRNIDYAEMKRSTKSADEPYFYLRNSQEEINQWKIDLYLKALCITNHFAIMDNTGTASYFFPVDLLARTYLRRGMCKLRNVDYRPNYESDSTSTLMISDMRPHIRAAIFGLGLFHDVFRYSCRQPRSIGDTYLDSPFVPGWGSWSYNSPETFDCVITPFIWDIVVYIPKEDIGKYSKFWVERITE